MASIRVGLLDNLHHKLYLSRNIFISWFGLVFAAAASFILLTLLILVTKTSTSSLFVRPVILGFDALSPNSSLVSWSFPLRNSALSSFSDGNATILKSFRNEEGNMVKEENTQFANLDLGVKNVSFYSDGKTNCSIDWDKNASILRNFTHKEGYGIKGDKTHFANLDLGVKNVSFHSDGDTNYSRDWDKNAIVSGNFTLKEGYGIKGGKTHLSNFDLGVKNVSFHSDGETNYSRDWDKNATIAGNFTLKEGYGIKGEKTHLSNFDLVVKNGSFHDQEVRGVSDLRKSEYFISDEKGKDVGNSGLFNTSFAKGYNDDGGLSRECDIFNGKWLRDDTLPHYPSGSCPYVDRDFNCHLNGRPDKEFYRWKWQPNGCDIPRLNATDFLERLRGKKLAFVGDSLNRNMWESLVCILRHSIKDKRRVYEISGKREFKKQGFYAFRFEDYNCSVDYVRAPFLVKESTFHSKKGELATLRLDLMDQTTKMYHDAHILIFNTGHWWTHEKTSRGEDYYQEGNYVHPRLKALQAYNRALTTWGRWVDRHVDANRTLVFFRGYSVTHFRGGQWNSGGQCNKETEPIFNETYLGNYPSKMRALEHVLRKMKTPVTYLNISRLTDYRKDAHPSIYRKSYTTPDELHLAEQSQDCSHWCLPGVPDVWNELLYASLVKAGWGAQKPGM